MGDIFSNFLWSLKTMPDYEIEALIESGAPELEVELTRKRNAAQRAYNDQKRTHESTVREAIWEAERRIKHFFDGIYGADQFRLWKELTEIESALTAEKERIALEGANSLYPLGTKVTRMKRVGRSYLSKEEPIYGVVEAVTRETVIPENLASYSRPSVGSFIVRLLKGDGTPSKKFENLYDHWKPVDPTVQKRVREMKAIEL